MGILSTGKWVLASVRVPKDQLNSVCLISSIPLEALKGEPECSIIYLSDPKFVFPEQSKEHPRTSHVDFVFLIILEDIAVKISQLNYSIEKILSVAQGPESTLTVITIL